MRRCIQAPPGVGFVWRSRWSGSQHAVVNVGGIQSLRHPDALFQYDAIDAAQAISKNWKAFFQLKGFEVGKAGGIESTIPVLVGTEIVSTLVKNDFLIHFRNEKLWLFPLTR